MIYELEIQLGSEKSKVFLQNGFFLFSAASTPVHSHSYTEIHLISGGSARFSIGDKLLEVSDGTMLAIPKNLFHYCLGQDENALHTAFQIDREIPSTALVALPDALSKTFFEEIGKLSESDDYTKISIYIALLCSYLELTPPLGAQALSDYGLLIHEFFSIRYKDPIRLCDLAQELHLSERQAERLVLLHTGHTFREELTATRLTVAERLLHTSAMSRTEVARYVGYESYAGFWKAKKKALENKKGS